MPGTASQKTRAATLFFSHPDFNRRLWNFTKSTAELSSNQGFDLNSSGRGLYRRLRFSLTPKNFVTGLSSH
jgi:hypothetical protein